MKRPNAILSLFLGSLLAGSCAMQAQSRSSQHLRANAAAHEVRISPTALADGSTSIDLGEDEWSVRGFGLKDLIAQVFDIDPRRIDLADSLAAAARYDVSLALTGDETERDIRLILKAALEKRFKMTIAAERREMEVYVLTSPDGPGPALRTHAFSGQRSEAALKQVALEEPAVADEDMERFSYHGQICPGVYTGGIAASAGSMAEFRRTLEPNLDKLLVDETDLPGNYDFAIGEFHSRDEMFRMLREQLGLAVVTAKRMVTMFAVRAA